MSGGAADARRADLLPAAAAGLAMMLAAPTALAQVGSATTAGRAIAFAPDKGGCVACHAIAGAEQAGDVGPALHDLRRRFPDAATLRARIRDARDFNPDTLMPPYGHHRILSEGEIEALVQFLYTL